MTRNRDSHLNGYDDYKRTAHDSASKVPFVIAGGAYNGGKIITDIVSTASLPKTILKIAGIDVGNAMVGENLIEVVEKTKPRKNEAFIQISESRIGRAIRTEDYLYSVYAKGLNGGDESSSDTYADDYMYDLKKDPNQLYNVVNDENYSFQKLALRGRLLAWIKECENESPSII